ncbi:hypothetical protein [Sinorhizobium meliloti]|uniref:hypothetical protein n=1 Tax=Rhizobium meliloti TaxID=382 RepID=UPI000FD7AF21|nr:hypothetical protein [Sinorhizobium meliloti]MDX0318928.1 hypothetical protein [Sinorhizobium meliloti]MDX0325476.1 hypothetical protein [Sinorhizobium meliloti]RVO65686.1 hypothetical protein CN087_20115 [Sinorhizobium meliloti]
MATVEEYKAAMNELADATQAFMPVAKFLKSLNEATNYALNSFLEATFGMASQSGRRTGSYDSKYRIDMAKWPSGEEVRAAGSRLAKAFNDAHRIYNELSQEDREYLKSPPYQPELR